MITAVGELEYQRHIRDLLMQMNFTHVGTLTLKPGVQTTARAETVCRKFRDKFNKSVFGKRWYETGFAALSFAAILQGFEKDGLHMHLALAGFPATLSEERLLAKFDEAAKYTDGVWERKHFEPMTGRWIEYITRDLRRRNDENFLAQYLTRGWSHAPKAGII